MARVLKNVVIQAIATTDLTELEYEVPARSVATASLVLSNQSASDLDITVYINNVDADHLLVSEKIPAGSGQTWFVKELNFQKLNSGYKVKVQATTTDAFKAFMSVSEISDS